jgi:hypothetical protein
MIGSWSGQYQYDNPKLQKAIGSEKTYFTITINHFDGSLFSGIVTDDIESGGMEGVGRIEGNIINEKVSFKKLMPKRVFIYKNGRRSVTSQKHPTIYYTGILTSNKTHIEGSWKINPQFVFLFGFIPIPTRSVTGKWQMQIS